MAAHFGSAPPTAARRTATVGHREIKDWPGCILRALEVQHSVGVLGAARCLCRKAEPPNLDSKRCDLVREWPIVPNPTVMSNAEMATMPHQPPKERRQL